MPPDRVPATVDERPDPTPEQAKANADAAFAVGALCGALGAVGREVIAAKIQHRFEEVIAAQEVTDAT